uniref:Secreted protein n=1 Tax=Acrobeloides nanus TaxID=290746 RepID=A0A914D3C4_9BILA
MVLLKPSFVFLCLLAVCREPTLPNQKFEFEERFRLKRDLIAIGSDEEPEPQNSTQTTIVPTTIEQIPAPEDSMNQPTESSGHKNKVHEKKLKSESSSEEQEKDKKEGRRIQNMPPKSEGEEIKLEEKP